MRIAVGLGKKGGEERLAQQGVSRRDFLKFCTAVAVTMGLGPSMATEVAAALTNRRASVVYLHCAECTGCSEALLRTCKPFLDTLILDTISLDYHETIMAAAGEAAEAALDQAISNPEGFICVVEGAIPTAMDGKYGYVGGHTMLDLCKRVLPKAKAVVTMGTCAAYGGVQAAKPNPTGSVGVNDCFAKLGMDVKAINIPGCPPNPLNLVGTLVAFLQNKEIKLDDLGRPLMFYGQSVHDLCERRVHFEAGEFASSFDSEEARKGWCLYDLGCKGPSTYNNCPKALFNETNWPVRAGHPCIGCSEPNFWDDLSPFYQN
ncbi:MAG: hydrogenase small subunit [Desulfovibrio sp.]|uniref:hydrogenase small subunit n=1 Tax=Desulfovibrio TaxID=872 RepID=UPI0026F2168E|nr:MULTISPECIES: hydrogenase small subunit [Desulfovibrio]MBS5807128.1 hydrogenase small subunit [Desulfovibrio piger]MEE0070501.1 hydrogenase small subunit [Desulfovibrio sp.]